MKEKTKVLAHRITWLVVICLIIFIPLIINWVQPKLAVVEEEAYIEEYYEYSNTSKVKIYITFNREVNYTGYATIKYYDSLGNLLDTEESRFTAEGVVAESFLIYIDGEVDSYEIVSYDFTTPTKGDWLYYFLLPAVVFLIESLLICYKEYECNGKKLSVYAGFYHHTLRVDGEKCDEHNTITSFYPIYLSTTMEDGIEVEATITTFNRISLKVNNKLLAQQHNNKKD